MVIFHSDMTQEGSRKFTAVSFKASPLTISIYTVHDAVRMKGGGGSLNLSCQKQAHITANLLQLLLLLWFHFTINSKESSCHIV